MQVKPEQLVATLERQLVPAIWVAGDEPLLVQETVDAARAHARRQGFSERQVFDAGPGFDWNGLLQSANSLSLFAERKLLELRLASAKPDAAARDALANYLAHPGEDNLLLITSGRLDKAATKAKWFQAIEQQICFVQVWPINAQQLPQWIQRRLRQHGLSADEEAVRLLAERLEGNLLAAAQEVEKLALLGGPRELDADSIMRAVADSARYNVFALIDAAVAGQSARALKILAHLRAEGAEPLQVLNLLCREARQLARMTRQLEQGRNLNAVMQAERVWSSRKMVVEQALRRHTLASLSTLLRQARVVDQAVKGLLPNNPWDELATLLLRMAGAPIVAAEVG